MPARRHGGEGGALRTWRGGTGGKELVFSGRKKKKPQHSCKGGCSYFLRRRREKKNKPKPEPFCLKPPGCGAKRAPPGSAARRRVPAPGRAGAARPRRGNSFILVDKRAHSGKKLPSSPLPERPVPVWRESFYANPPRVFLPRGGNVEGGPPRGGCAGGRVPFAAAHAVP